MNEANLNQLQAMLEELSPRQRKTVQACWEPFCWGEWDAPLLLGIGAAARVYKHALSIQVLKGTKAPHEAEEELQSAANAARDLAVKINRLMPDTINALEFLTADGMRQELMEFVMYKGPDELEALARVFDQMAKAQASRKESPNGLRRKTALHQDALEQLLSNIGRMTSFRMCHISHILPIAKVVHKWATGETPGGDWGGRPFENVKPMIKALRWSDPEEIRKTLHRPRMPVDYSSWQVDPK